MKSSKFAEALGKVPCSKCGKFIGKRSKVCPSCGAMLVDRRVNEIGDFSSLSRVPQNSGYTQHTKARSSQPDYTGVEVTNQNDSEYFSSETNRYIGTYGEKQKRRILVQDNSVFFGGRENREEEEDTPKYHISDINPYEIPDMTKKTAQLNDHSTQYTASNVLEFTKHRYGKHRADMINLFQGLVIISVMPVLAIAIHCEHTRLSWIPAILMVAAAIICALITVKLYKRPAVITETTIIVVCSAALAVMLPWLLKVEPPVSQYWYKAPDIIMMYAFVVTSNVLCIPLLRNMSAFQTLWEGYKYNGDELIETERTTEDIKFYVSEKENQAVENQQKQE